MLSKVSRFFSTSRKDYYKILEVTPSATKEEIKAAYFKLAKYYHPDIPTGNAEKFKEIEEAKSVLTDDAQRKEYDNSRLFENRYDSRKDPFQNGFSQNPNGFYQWQQGPYSQRGPFANPFDDFDRIFRENQKKASESKKTETKSRGRTKRTEYYEYYNPKTGRRVFYSFKTSYNKEDFDSNKENFDSNKKQSFFRDFFMDLNADEKKNSHGLDIFLLGMFIFTLIFFFSIIVKVTQRSPYRDPFEEEDYPPRKYHVWDKFAKDMHENETEDK